MEFASLVWRGSEELSRTIFAVAWYVLGSSSETSSTTAASGRTIMAISSLLRRSASRYRPVSTGWSGGSAGAEYRTRPSTRSTISL